MAHEASGQKEVGYSYFQSEFVSFYEQMVLECYGGTKASDVHAYCSLLQQKLGAAHAHGRDVVVADLGCGSGRALLAFLEFLAPIEHPPCKLHMYGIDNSTVFLEAAQTKCTALLEQHPRLKHWTSITWLQGSFEAWELPRQQRQQADLILVAGAGLHHVTSTAGVQAALQLMKQQLSPQGLCVISYLPWEELYRDKSLTSTTAEGSSTTTTGSSSSHCTSVTAEEFRVKGYKRVLLAREVEQQQDGSCVLHERFALSKLVGNDEGQTEWCIEEGWHLRRLEQHELLSRGSDAGLVPLPAPLLMLHDAGTGAGGLAVDARLSAGSIDDVAAAKSEHQDGPHYVVFCHKLCQQ